MILKYVRHAKNINNMNPVSKARKIVEAITKDVWIQNKLLSAITRELSVKEIDNIFEELKPNYQLKLNL